MHRGTLAGEVRGRGLNMTSRVLCFALASSGWLRRPPTIGFSTP
jgi:hypothetical protein